MKRVKRVKRSRFRRFEFADGTFLYMDLCFRNLNLLLRQRKLHGKILRIKKMEKAGYVYRVYHK